MDTTQFKAVKNYVVKKYSLSCATCSIEDDWVTFINGYLSSKTTIPNNDIINGLSCRYMNRALFENLGRPEVINVLKEEGGSVLTFSLANGQSIMRWTRDNDAVWKGGSSVKINNGGTTWNVNNSTYNLINLSVTEPDSSVNNDSKIMLLTPFSNPCYVNNSTNYVEYQIDPYLLNPPTIYLPQNDNPYLIGHWSVNGAAFEYQEFKDFDQLANILRVWDAGGNWVYDAVTGKIKGGVQGRIYDSLQILLRDYTSYSSGNYNQEGDNSFWIQYYQPLSKPLIRLTMFVNGVRSDRYKLMPDMYAFANEMNLVDPGGHWQLRSPIPKRKPNQHPTLSEYWLIDQNL